MDAKMTVKTLRGPAKACITESSRSLGSIKSDSSLNLSSTELSQQGLKATDAPLPSLGGNDGSWDLDTFRNVNVPNRDDNAIYNSSRAQDQALQETDKSAEPTTFFGRIGRLFGNNNKSKQQPAESKPGDTELALVGRSAPTSPSSIRPVGQQQLERLVKPKPAEEEKFDHFVTNHPLGVKDAEAVLPGQGSEGEVIFINPNSNYPKYSGRSK